MSPLLAVIQQHHSLISGAIVAVALLGPYLIGVVLIAIRKGR